MGDGTRTVASVKLQPWVPALAVVLLVVASGFKGWQLITEADPHLGTLPVSATVLALLIAIELSLAWWLCIARTNRWVLVATALLFTGFTGWTTYQTLQGDLSCGCFGVLSIPPALMLSADLVLASGLWLCVRGSTTTNIRWWHWLGPALIVGVVATVAWWRSPPAHAPTLTGTGDPRPIAAVPGWRYRPGMSVGISDLRVMRGTWRIICYRYACPHCQANLATWAYEAREAVARGESWAFLRLDGPEQVEDLLSDRMAGDLPRWRRTMPMMRTPALLTVVDGTITAVAETWGPPPH